MQYNLIGDLDLLRKKLAEIMSEDEDAFTLHYVDVLTQQSHIPMNMVRIEHKGMSLVVDPIWINKYNYRCRNLVDCLRGRYYRPAR